MALTGSGSQAKLPVADGSAGASFGIGNRVELASSGVRESTSILISAARKYAAGP
jgi:hypothetical protein